MAFEVAIIGGGASGLTALITLLKHGVDNVVLLERLDRVGKKLVATGNGQGNLMNLNLSPENYHSDTEGFFINAIDRFGVRRYKEFLSDLGVVFTEEKSGKVYPMSKQASSVLDLMRGYLTSKNADIRTGFFVKELTINKDKTFTVRSENGETVVAKRVFVATGGNCQKQFGTDGNGYNLLKKLGHTVTPIYPSLVQLKSDSQSIKGLHGIKEYVKAHAVIDGKIEKTVEGELLFTDYGVSGNAIFELSGLLAKAEGKKREVVVEFMPSFSENDVRAMVEARNRLYYVEKQDLLTGFVHKTLGRALVKTAKSNAVRDVVANAKNFRINITGTTGFNYAQVTKGGVCADEVNHFNMGSKLVKNLYILGELLDVDGDCGGYNLQWAFSSASSACRNVLVEMGAL